MNNLKYVLIRQNQNIQLGGSEDPSRLEPSVSLDDAIHAEIQKQINKYDQDKTITIRWIAEEHNLIKQFLGNIPDISTEEMIVKLESHISKLTNSPIFRIKNELNDMTIVATNNYESWRDIAVTAAATSYLPPRRLNPGTKFEWVDKNGVTHFLNTKNELNAQKISPAVAKSQSEIAMKKMQKYKAYYNEYVEKEDKLKKQLKAMLQTYREKQAAETQARLEEEEKKAADDKERAYLVQDQAMDALAENQEQEPQLTEAEINDIIEIGDVYIERINIDPLPPVILGLEGRFKLLSKTEPTTDGTQAIVDQLINDGSGDKIVVGEKTTWTNFIGGRPTYVNYEHPSYIASYLLYHINRWVISTIHPGKYNYQMIVQKNIKWEMDINDSVLPPPGDTNWYKYKKLRTSQEYWNLYINWPQYNESRNLHKTVQMKLGRIPLREEYSREEYSREEYSKVMEQMNTYRLDDMQWEDKVKEENARRKANIQSQEIAARNKEQRMAANKAKWAESTAKAAQPLYMTAEDKRIAKAEIRAKTSSGVGQMLFGYLPRGSVANPAGGGKVRTYV